MNQQAQLKLSFDRVQSLIKKLKLGDESWDIAEDEEEYKNAKLRLKQRQALEEVKVALILEEFAGTKLEQLIK